MEGVVNRAVQFLGVLLIGFVIWAVVDYNGLRDAVRHYYRGRTAVTAQGVDNLRAEAQRHAESESRLIELEAQSVATSLGKSAASRYRMCHTDPPSAGQAKEKCDQLDARLRAEEAKRGKHPL